MAQRPSQSNGRDRTLAFLNASIVALGVAKDACGIPPAQIAFGIASALLTMIKDTMSNKDDYIELGRFCGEVCEALYDRLEGKRPDELDKSVLVAIEHLTQTLEEIRATVDKQSVRNSVSRFLHSMSDKEAIATWRQNLNTVLHIFNTKLAINTNKLVTDIHHSVVDNGSASQQHHSTRKMTVFGEMPPPPPPACFGREELINNIVDLAEKLKPFALIGTGGIGKTTIALAVLHHSRIKERFGDNCRFIRCDRFAPSYANLLARIAEVTGAGIKNPENLAALRPFLSSREMILFLDNAESILDLPAGRGGKEIKSAVEELSRYSNISLGITSRLITVPPHFKFPPIDTLSMEAAREIFRDTYVTSGRPDIVDNLIRQLDFHPLSIKLLACAAHENGWDHDKLAEEWKEHRAQMLKGEYDGSLGATIDLSLKSQTLSDLGSAAGEFLKVIAFFPQGIDNKNIDWLFPSIPNRHTIFSTFHRLSLTYRNDNFITMLAPIRSYLYPQDPKSSPLLSTVKDQYLARLSVDINPSEPGFGGTQWIRTEDTNVEHLLDIFTSIDTTLDDTWNACSRFLEHLFWNKPRRTVLSTKVEMLPDSHPAKSECLFWLSESLDKMGNHTERARVLSSVITLERSRGDEKRIIRALRELSDANRWLRLFDEGMEQAKEALEISERLGDPVEQAHSLDCLARLLLNSDQLDAAEQTELRAMELFPERGQEYLVSRSHYFLGQIYRRKGTRDKSIHHFEASIAIASRFGFYHFLFWNNYFLALLFLDQERLNDALAHTEQAKSHACGGEPYKRGRVMKLQAEILYRRGDFEEAKSETQSALEIFELLGTPGLHQTECRVLLLHIEQALEKHG